MSTLVYEWESVSPVRRDRIEDGEKAIIEIDKSHKQTFRDWLRVGAALDDMQHAVQDLAGTNEVKGSAYNAAWAVVAQHAPTLAKIDKATRSNAIWIHTNRETVEEWHAALPINQKRSINHPATIVRKLKPKEPKEPKEPKKATGSALDHAVGRIENVADQVERSIGGTMAMAFDMAPELIRESAQNFIEIYGKEDTSRFVDTLLDLLLPPRTAFTESLDPAFKESLDIKQRIREVRGAHPEWTHQQIGKVVKRGASVVARVLNETVTPDSLEAQITRALAQSAGKKKIRLRVANMTEVIDAQRLLNDRPGGNLIAVETKVLTSRTTRIKAGKSPAAS